MGPPGHPRELKKGAPGGSWGRSKNEDLIFRKQLFRLDETAIFKIRRERNNGAIPTGFKERNKERAKLKLTSLLAFTISIFPFRGLGPAS